MTNQLDNFLAVAEWKGYRLATAPDEDEPGTLAVAILCDGEDEPFKHVAVLCNDLGLVTYVSMRWRYSQKMGGGWGRLWRTLDDSDHAALFGTAVGWLMQPIWDVEPRPLPDHLSDLHERKVTWCPVCGEAHCKCEDSETPAWGGTAVWEPIP